MITASDIHSIKMTKHHILAPFHLIGGGVWHAIDFATALTKSGADAVHLWSQKPTATPLTSYPITTITPYSGNNPDGGHLWVIGPDVEIGHWYASSRFEQVTLIYNQHAPDLFYHCMHILTKTLQQRVNIVYASSALAKEIGIPGTIKPPLFDAERFFNQAVPEQTNAKDQQIKQAFRVGRTSRDVRYKHHVDDPELYNMLLAMECQVELIGATCIADRLPCHPAMTVRSEIPQSALPEFLGGLDCFVYRTSPRKPEGFGLCIIEAMAAGLPVVAARWGGYVDIIRSGNNGFLFDTNEEAIGVISKLKENPDLRTQVGFSARETFGRLFSG
jgi:hypothetical protein